MSIKPSSDYFHCSWCGIKVAFIKDLSPPLTANDLVNTCFLTSRLYNVDVAENELYRRKTLARIYCSICKNLLGFKLIAFSQPSRNYRVGFYLKMNDLVCWNNVTLLDLLLGSNNEQAPNDQDGGAVEEQDHDQNGGANEENADQDGDANEQGLGANEQNADQHGGGNQQVPNEQDLGANEQNADLDGGGDQQVPNKQDLGINGQNADQELGANNEQNKDANEQDGGCCSCLM